MTFYKRLEDHLKDHDSLASKLQSPLKQVHIGGGCVFSSRRLPGADRDPVVSVAPEANELLADNDYKPAWEIADELFDQYEIE